jgi:hypothetical protein
VSCFSNTHNPLTIRGKSSTHRLLSFLEASTPSESSPALEKAIKNYCLRSSGKGIVVVLTDLMNKTGYDAAFRMLVAREMDIYLVHVLSPEEIKPELAGDLKLIDSEDGDSREISVSAALLARYQSTLAAFIHSAKNFCNKRGIAYVPAQSDQPVEELVTRYLRDRGLVR